MAIISVFPIIGFLLIAGTQAQDIKGRSFEGQPSRPSPAAYSRQQYQKSLRDESQPNYGQRINPPAVANPDNYLRYNNAPSDGSDLMDVKPRPIIIPRPKPQPQQQPQQIYSSNQPESDSRSGQPLGQPTPSTIIREQQPRFFSTSSDVDGRSEPQQSRQFSRDQAQADWNQYIQRYGSSPSSQPMMVQQGRMFGDSGAFYGQTRPQSIQISRPIMGPTPVVYHPPAPAKQFRLMSPMYRPIGGMSSFGFQGGLQPVRQFIQRPNVMQFSSEPHVAIPIAQHRIQGPILGSVGSQMSQPFPVTQSVGPARQIPFNIPAPYVGAPLVQIRRSGQQPTIQYNSADSGERRPQSVTYQVSRADPIVTRSEIHTPVFVTGNTPSGEYKYTISQGPQSQPMSYRVPQSIPSQPLHYLPSVSRNDGQPTQYYRLPVETVRTQSSRPISNFYVPPYMHPYTHGLYPIQTIRHQPMYYNLDSFGTDSDSNQVQQQKVLTLPTAGDSQPKPVTTVTIEQVPREQEGVTGRVDQSTPSEGEYRNGQPNVITVPAGRRPEPGQPLIIPTRRQQGQPQPQFVPQPGEQHGPEPKIEYVPNVDDETSEHEPGYGPQSYPRPSSGTSLGRPGSGWVAQEPMAMENKFSIEDGRDGGISLQAVSAKNKK